MIIGIDCRMYGLKHAGIGRYVMNLVEELLKQDKENDYVMFVRDVNDVNITRYQDNKITIVVVNAPHYSLKEQLKFPKIIKREKVDLMHFPHFNVPIFYRGKYIVTIHDLIKHTSKGKLTTTRLPLLYWIKYLGYKIVFNQAVKKANRIITPSQFVKDELLREYKVDPNKVVVIYEGVDQKFSIFNFQFSKKNKILEKYKIIKPYLLYVGSVYPHKNVERLIEAVKILNQSLITNHQPLITLVVVCARSVFLERLREKIIKAKAEDYVNLLGFVSDEKLAVLYKRAEAFVFPTLSEGFGLPGLEAMSFDCPVICSDIPVLREIYKDAADYFNPLEPFDIAEKISAILLDKNKQERLRNEENKLLNTYSWSKMAKETLSVYQEAMKD